MSKSWPIESRPLERHRQPRKAVLMSSSQPVFMTGGGWDPPPAKNARVGCKYGGRAGDSLRPAPTSTLAGPEPVMEVVAESLSNIEQ